MWEHIKEHFERYPAQGKVARIMLRLGLTIKDGAIFSGPVQLSDSALARALDVDRRVVVSTVETIEGDGTLRSLFSHLKPTCNLSEVGPEMGWGVLVLIPKKANIPGIIAEAGRLIAESGISIKQLIIEDDLEFSDRPQAYIITERPIPPRTITRIKDIEGIEGVTLR